jgi:hypothetical protein
MVIVDCRVDCLAPQRPQALQCPFLVGPGKPTIAGDIGGEDRGETASSSHPDPRESCQVEINSKSLAYFGYPRADEHDAERAVRAGLQLVEAVAALDTPAEMRLRLRVGVATGLVVVGDLIGEGASQEQAVVGETPNLAARLQALAEPGSVVIAPATRRLLGNRFRLQALGLQRVKGLTEPVETWAVEGVSASEGRFEAVRSGLLTGFVGREHELRQLRARLGFGRDDTAEQKLDKLEALVIGQYNRPREGPAVHRGEARRAPVS